MAKRSRSRGKALAARLRDGLAKARTAPLAGARLLPVISGVSPSGTAAHSLENALIQAETEMVKAVKVFSYGNSVVLEQRTAEESYLVTLATGAEIETAAPALLANLVVCGRILSSGVAEQYPPPPRFVAALLNREPTRAALPRINMYARRPLFDTDFRLRGPGWHEDLGLLIHGTGIEPAALEEPDLTLPAIARLPRHLRELLRDFPFRENADVANTLAVLITGAMITHFVEDGKPLVLLDGNQPGLGKTLLARVIGMVLDGEDPTTIHFTADEEELQKRICATLRGGSQTQLLLDNAKLKAATEIHSPVIESNSMAPVISLRILGQSVNYTRPNDVIWHLTMNDTKASTDLVSRGLPIRQYFEGDPKLRDFGGRSPLDYARRHRQEILAELMGMVVRWNQIGRPLGPRPHRLTHWAQVVGGLVCANGFPEVLTNLDTAAAEFDTGMDALAALAEAAVKSPKGPVFYA